MPIMNSIHPAIEARGFFAESGPSGLLTPGRAISKPSLGSKVPCRWGELHTSLFTGIQENQGDGENPTKSHRYCQGVSVQRTQRQESKRLVGPFPALISASSSAKWVYICKALSTLPWLP